MTPAQYESRCEAHEAEGLSRSDAQAAVDAEERHPELRAKAHGLAADAAAAGFRIEFGDRSCPDADLRGKWWWTFRLPGCDCESGPDVFATAAEAAQAAADAFDDGYDIDSDKWEAARAYFGLDESSTYSAKDRRQYIRDIELADQQATDALQLLRDLVAWQAPKFDEDVEDKNVNGGDAVDFIAEIRQRAKAVLATTSGA